MHWVYLEGPSTEWLNCCLPRMEEKRREDGCDDLFDCIIFLAEWFCFILFLISYLFLVVSIFIWQIKLTNRQIFD